MASSSSLAPFLLLSGLLLLAACGSRTGLGFDELAAVPPLDASAPDASVHTGVFLFGGEGTGGAQFNDTWRWDGREWTEVLTAVAPPARSNAVFVPFRTSLLLVGGLALDASSGLGATADTWTWDGAAWKNLHPLLSPPSIYGGAAGALGGSVALFGGWGDHGDPSTWLWNGANWKEQPVIVAATRFGLAAAPLGGALVVFGGENDSYEPTGSTSTWDGSAWTEVTPAHSPSARRGASMAAFKGKIVLFGGENTGTSTPWASLGDTWIWDGNDWTEVKPSASPSPRAWSAMAATDEGVVLFGGQSAAGQPRLLGDTWIWNGVTWSQRGVTGPSARNAAVMANLSP